jgi:hypothetical protein
VEEPRTSTTEHDTPRIVKVATWFAFLNTWALFEELVVDRYGLWKFMPFYRVGRLCPWDLAATVVITLVVRNAWRPRLS